MSRLLNNNKALLFIIAVLLITNIAVIIFYFTRPCGRREDRGFSPGEAMALFLKNDVHFSPEQLQQFDSLRKENRKVLKPLFKNMAAVKDSFYRQISDVSITDSLFNSELDTIAAVQKRLDKAMFHHFRDVRTLCTPEQLPLYDSLVQQLIIKRMTHPFRKSGPYRKDTIEASHK